MSFQDIAVVLSGVTLGFAAGYTALDLFLAWYDGCRRKILQIPVPEHYCGTCGSLLQTYCPHNPRWQRLY